MLAWVKIKRYLCKQCVDNECTVVLYHSLGLLKVIDLFTKKKKNFILEMEEIYADVIGNERIRKREIEAAHKASGYIFPTQMLNLEINIESKPAVIVHGTYQVEPDRKCTVFDNGLHKEDCNIIHCVYAGTFDPRKRGAQQQQQQQNFFLLDIIFTF